MASNNWVIHGNYTKTGKPLLAGDPHLGNQLPSHWYLMEMTYEGVTCIGATHPGIPQFMFGKTAHMSWAITSALTDLSDLFKEKLNEAKSQYKVDGEWRNLRVVKEEIKVKGGPSIPFEIKYTHRGPLVDIALLQGADVLFAEGIPSAKNNNAVYSFAWSGDIPEETTVEIVRNFMRAKHIDEII